MNYEDVTTPGAVDYEPVPVLPPPEEPEEPNPVATIRGMRWNPILLLEEVA